MKEDIAGFFPELQARSGELYGVMTVLAAVLVLAGLIVRLNRAGTDPGQIIRSLTTAGIIAIAIGSFPDWVNELQLLSYDLVEGMDASPSSSHERFALLVADASEQKDGKQPGLWDVLWAEKGGLGQAIVYACVFVAAKVASAVMWLFFIVQQALVLFQTSLAPVFLAMFMIGALSNTATQFLLRLVAVLLWPLGWAIADLLTDSLLKAAAASMDYKNFDESLASGQHTSFFILVITLWVLISTIGAPLIIWKLLSSGANAGSMLFAQMGMATVQGTLYGTAAGATASLAGGSRGTSLAAGMAGGMGGIASGAMLTSGAAIPSAIGVGAAMATAAASKKSNDGPVDFNAEAANIAGKSS